jgi:hypothetical protein
MREIKAEKIVKPPVRNACCDFIRNNKARLYEIISNNCIKHKITSMLWKGLVLPGIFLLI